MIRIPRLLNVKYVEHHLTLLDHLLATPIYDRSRRAWLERQLAKLDECDGFSSYSDDSELDAVALFYASGESLYDTLIATRAPTP